MTTMFLNTLSTGEFPQHTEPLPQLTQETHKSNAPAIKDWIKSLKEQTGRDITEPSEHGARESRKLIAGILRSALDVYANDALRLAVVEQLDDGSYYAEIPQLAGVWANADTEGQVRQELLETTVEWLEMKIQDKDEDIPLLNHLDISALARYITSSIS